MDQSKTRTAPRRAATASVAEQGWAFRATNAAVLHALAARTHAQSLREYFGTQAFEELSLLALEARQARRTAGGPRVLLIPGMMGSILCDMQPSARRPGTGGQVLWIDPLRIAAGRLKDLVLPSLKSIRARGVLLPSYARLKLKLTIEGFDAKFFAYDWRLGIDEMGAKLAAKIAAEGQPVTVIAHSMGALVARIAAKRLPRGSVRKLIMLGAPNQGSFAPVQALRGTYPFVQKLSRIDLKHSPDYLAAQIFSTFPGLYQMLPALPPQASVDLLDPAFWPGIGPKPRAELLARVTKVRAKMAPADSRMVQIAGVNRTTVVAVRRTRAGFEYGSSREGDGTVPLAMALLPGLKTYFADEAHGNLASNPKIVDAIIDLVRDGRTRALEQRFAPRPSVESRTDDAELSSIDRSKIDWRLLDSVQREAAMADLDGVQEEASPGSGLSLA